MADGWRRQYLHSGGMICYHIVCMAAEQLYCTYSEHEDVYFVSATLFRKNCCAPILMRLYSVELVQGLTCCNLLVELWPTNMIPIKKHSKSRIFFLNPELFTWNSIFWIINSKSQSNLWTFFQFWSFSTILSTIFTSFGRFDVLSRRNSTSDICMVRKTHIVNV